MKHVKIYEDYSEEEIKDLVTDLKTVGLSDWQGYFITYQLRTNDGIGSEAIAVVGQDLQKVAKFIFEHFNLDPEDAEIDISNLKTVESVLDEIENYFSSDMGDPWMDFEYKIVEMKPRDLKNEYTSSYLLALGSVIEMGKSFFVDFDSQVSKITY